MVIFTSTEPLFSSHTFVLIPTLKYGLPGSSTEVLVCILKKEEKRKKAWVFIFLFHDVLK